MANKQPEIAERISRVSDPLEAKRLGSIIETPRGWEEDQGRTAMKEVVKKKFSQNQELNTFLRSLPNLPIIECNKYDRYWGVGCGLPEAERSFPRITESNNHLGKILSEVKLELK